jgi:IgGFc binding protein
MHARSLWLVLLSGSFACSDKGGTALLDGGSPRDSSVVDLDGFGSVCFGSTFMCEGTRAIPCDNGEPGNAKDCAASGQVCAPSVGCVECIPGTTSCEDGHATWCRADGTLAEFECDEVQGLSCEPSGCFGACALNAIHDSYIGCDYYPTVTLNPVWSGFAFAVAVANTAPEPTQVTITRGDQVVREVTVAANALETIELPWVVELKGGDVACTQPPLPGPSRLTRDGAYRLRSDQPVTVYQFSPLEYQLDPIPAGCPVIDPSKGMCVPHDQLPMNAACLSYSNDASLLLPATALTGNYTALAWPSQSEGGRPTGSGFVAITATQDGTRVEVRGAGKIAPGAGMSATGGSVTLDRGDVLELVADAESDISGTRVRADKAVQVIAGQSCAYVPDKSVLNCDHIEEAMFPEDALGATYVVSMPVVLTYPDDETPTPYVLRASAILDRTEITFDPAVHERVTLNAGEYVDVQLTKDNVANVLVKSQRPFQIATYMVGQAALPGGGILGDPSQSLAIPVEQFRTDYLFTAPTSYALNFASVIALQGTTVHVDGRLIESDEFTPVGGSDYGVAQVVLDDRTSVHSLEADEEVGLTVYGYGWYTSYMYPGGADLDRITVPPIL